MSDDFDRTLPSEEEPSQPEPPLQPSSSAAKSARPGEELFYWLQTLVSALVCIVLIFTFFGRFTRVMGESMVPTLLDGELLLVWSLAYEPEQGDIVVLNKTTAEFLGGDAIVKRVIAVGGQTVDIDYEAGIVYVDGAPLADRYINGPMHLPPSHFMQETHFEIPDGSIFVMGDNRNHSSDSRDERLGAVDTRYVLGKAIFIFFPFSSMGTI